MESEKLLGKVALVTGASRGIGRAIATLYAEEGAKIAVNYYTSDIEASNLIDEINSLGGEAISINADVSKVEDVRTMIAKTLDSFTQIDILVNNAGIFLPVPFFDSTEQIWDRTLNINLKGAYLCSKEVAPIMMRQRRGKIINIASNSGLAERSALENTPYVVSKAGMIGLTRSLAVNLSPYIHVNAICPGLIETEMTSYLSQENKKAIIQDTPLKRVGNVMDIAKTAVFLASEDSDFITGEIITVSGGKGMR